jgi:dTDP-4-dehydrorhamnose 3,5-epimerase
MKVIGTCIQGCFIIEPDVFRDERGFFLETYQDKRYRELLQIDQPFVQDNFSESSGGVLRGLHFQKTKPQGKLVRVIGGEVFDVAVDLRPESATFRQWQGLYLSDQNHRQFWLPPGLAHGFVAVSRTACLEYKCTDYYAPDDEGCLIWNDPELNIDWPVADPQLSDKDQQGMSLRECLQ